jgi:hypothetical protein
VAYNWFAISGGNTSYKQGYRVFILFIVAV